MIYPNRLLFIKYVLYLFSNTYGGGGLIAVCLMFFCRSFEGTAIEHFGGFTYDGWAVFKEKNFQAEQK